MGKIKTTGKVIEYVAPVFRGPDLDRQIAKALGRKDIQKELKNYKGSPEEFEQGLREYIERENKQNYRLIKTAEILDTKNKALVPVDTTLDAFNFFAGVGYAARGIITLFKLPIYLAYDAYYAGKTHDIKGSIENIGYEGLSWLSPGSLPHLINHYTRQAEDYGMEKGSKGFLNSLEKKAKILQFPKNQSGDLEELAKAA